MDWTHVALYWKINACIGLVELCTWKLLYLLRRRFKGRRFPFAVSVLVSFEHFEASLYLRVTKTSNLQKYPPDTFTFMSVFLIKTQWKKVSNQLKIILIFFGAISLPKVSIQLAWISHGIFHGVLHWMHCFFFKYTNRFIFDELLCWDMHVGVGTHWGHQTRIQPSNWNL